MTIRAAGEEEWPGGDFRAAAKVRRSARQITDSFGVRFTRIEEDGLGSILSAGCITSSGTPFLLHQCTDAPEPHQTHLLVYCLSGPLMTDAVEDVLESLAIPWKDLLWTNEEIRFEPQEIWRQDDNGNRFLVEVAPCRVEAKRIIRRLESGGHKQIYWLVPRAQG